MNNNSFIHRKNSKVIYFMKQKKSSLKKFHRKYIFLQNSLFDFLQWRSAHFSKEKDCFYRNEKTNSIPEGNRKKYLLDEEKICLQEYWKSSENQKIQKSIQNINTNFAVSKNLENLEKSKKKILLSSLKFNENRKKALNSFRIQKHFKKIRNFQTRNSNFESFIPESDCFRSFKFFSFFTNHKFGQFFPKKKNFQQYWVFPLLGFVVLFSSPYFSKTFQEKYFEKNTKNFVSSKFQKLQKKLFLSKNLLNDKTIFNELQKNQGFSYSEKFSQETYKHFQKLEKYEYQNFCDFYLSFFKNSMTNIFINENFLLFFGNSLFENSKFSTKNFKKTLDTKRNVLNWKWYSFEPDVFILQKKMNFFNVEIPQKALFFNSKNKKSFLSENQNIQKETKIGSKIFKIRKVFSNITPVAEFSKASFLLNEFQRNSYFNIPFLKMEKNQSFDSHSQFSDFSGFNDFQTSKQEKVNNHVALNSAFFLKNLEKQDFNFLHSLFLESNVSEKKNIQNGKFVNIWDSKFSQKNSFIGSFDEKDQEIREKNSKNLFFLEKWFQTQNFWQISSFSQKKEKFSLKNISPNFFLKENNNFRKFHSFKKDEKQKIQFENFMNLDSLYFQKLVRFQFYKNFEKDKDLTKKTKISNFFNFHLRNDFPLNFKDREFLNSSIDSSFQQFSQTKTKKEKDILLFKFKNQTSRFFLFQYYDTKFKNFSKEFLLKKKKSFFLSPFSSESKIKKSKVQNFENFLNILFFKNFIHNQIFEEKNAKKRETFNQISNFDIPIFLDFANKKSFENIFIFNKRGSFLSFSDFDFPLISSPALPSSLSFSLSPCFPSLSSRTPSFPFFPSGKQGDKEGRTKRGKIERDENKKNESFPFEKTLSIRFFKPEGFFQKEGVKGSVKTKKEMENSFLSFFEEKTSIKFNSKNLCFFCSKNVFFERICEKTMQQFNKSWSTLKNGFFKKLFFIEKIKKEKPFIFTFLQNKNKTNQKQKGVQFSKLHFFLKNSKNNSFLIKQRKQFFLSNESKIKNSSYVSFIPVFPSGKMRGKGNFEKIFQNFQSRKFEKIFRAFLSPINKKQILEDSFFTSNYSIQNLPFFLEPHFSQRENSERRKGDIDSLFLKTLSKSFKNKACFSFFFAPQIKNEKKINFVKRKKINTIFFISPAQRNTLKPAFSQNSNTFESDFSLKGNLSFDPVNNEGIEEGRETKNEKKFFQSEKSFHSEIQTDSIRPTLLLKREGFIHVPKYKKFSDVNFENFLSENKKFLKRNSYFSEISQKDENQLTLQRIEKEKSFQKKRRMKKQKLETRRRKKRKRFFPRPIWLRFHFYKKFLKTRHPENLLSKNLSSICFFSEKQKKGNFLKKFKTVQIVFPKKLNNKNQKNFLNSNTLFSIQSKKTKNSYSSMYLSFEKKWKKVFSSSFLKKKKQKKIFSIFKKMFQNSPNFSFGNSQRRTQKSKVLKNQNEIELLKIYRKNRRNIGLTSRNSLHEKIFYNKFPFSKNFREAPIFFYGSENNPISQNREDYKISGDILSEFLRLSWKSYWFQMNFQSYTHRISQYFRKMQKIESQNNFSNSNFLNILENSQNSILLKNFSSLFQKTSFESSQNDLIFKKFLFNKFFWYSNIRNSLESKPVFRDSLLTGNQNFLNFQKIQNFPEYNRILYSRVSDILQNFKNSETNDENSNQQLEKILKIPKRKNDPIFSNSSFFTKFAMFYENFNILSQPSIPAFSMFSSLFNDVSIKPSGELPTLRALWALKQTNISFFQEKNNIRNFWTLKKRIDSLKSLKLTKKAIHFFQKYSGFDKFKTSNLSKYIESGQNCEIQQPQFEFKEFVLRKKPFFKKNKKKFLVLSTINSGLKNSIEELENLSLEKFRNVQKKCSIFGIKTLEQKSKISLRYFKFHLLSSLRVNKTEKNLFFSPSFEKIKPSPQNSAKNSLNFWWSSHSFPIPPLPPIFPEWKTGRGEREEGENQKNGEFFLSSENKIVYDSNFFHLSTFHKFKNFQKFNSILQEKIEQDNFMNQTNLFFPKAKFLFDSDFVSEQKNKKLFGSQTLFLWFGTIVFQMALLFSFFKLPEIRSVFKFTLVLLYKFSNGFFVLVFSIYTFFKKYTTRGTHVVKKILSKSSYNSEKSFLSFQSNVLEKNLKLQKISFSRTMSIQDKKFFNLFFSSLLSSQKYTSFSSNKRKQKFFFMNFFYIFQKRKTKDEFFDLFVRFSKIPFLSPDQQKFSPSHSFLPSSPSRREYLPDGRDWIEGPRKFPFLKKTFGFSFLKRKKYKKNKEKFWFYPTLQVFFKKNQIQHKSKNFKKSQNFGISKKKIANFSNLKNFKLSNTEKILCNFALSFLFFGKNTTHLSYTIVHLSSKISAKFFDGIEILMFSIYKFLEKPAELMIEWIALIFLIEWSSDMATFIPDTLDISLAQSSHKFLRPVRSGSLFLNFLSCQQNQRVFPFYTNVLTFGPLNVGNFFAFFGYSNMLSFIFQKCFFSFFENFSFIFTKPDMDIFIRQRKGLIFWDIWTEIFFKAAEKYNISIASFVTLKEEQELFIERFLQDQQFLKTLEVENSNPGFFDLFLVFNKKQSEYKQYSLNAEILQQNSLSSFVNNFLVKERPQEFSDICFQGKNKQFHQFLLFSYIFPSLNYGKKTKFDTNFFSNLFLNQKKNQKLFEKNQTNFILQKLQTKPNFSLFKQNNSLNFFIENFVFLFFKKRRSEETNKILASFPFNPMGRRDARIFFPKNEKIETWSWNQYGTFRGLETDLFVDIYPPKSLKHIQFFQYSEPAQYTLGTFICQIYSGIFSKQVSKNILVIGDPGTAKTLFIQALAGETEMKIITDNAYRYSMVLRGVAVGMKYLRDVFDALVLQTPCFFLMEHIHGIGSKRPLLISDDENVQGFHSSFGLDQQEVHETNQMIYQSTRHSISDYKRPYKGDFSMGIPTNFFLQNFYSKNGKNSTSIFKNSQFSAGGGNFIDRNSPVSPLPLDAIENSLESQGFAEKEKTEIQNSFRADFFQKMNFTLQSRLQLSKEQIFAPPATSPFTILMLKEQKKLLPKKIVKETSWGGLSADQLISYNKENSSVRAKVAVLAEKTLNLSRGKFDIITDLLVIIDSVRSNRGFVVFGTTHLPSLLDPALRRPGRFDETLSFAQSPTFFNRFEIFKTNFENSLTTLDFLDSSIFTENFSEFNLLNLITGTKLSLFHQIKYLSPSFSPYHSTSDISSIHSISRREKDTLRSDSSDFFKISSEKTKDSSLQERSVFKKGLVREGKANENFKNKKNQSFSSLIDTDKKQKIHKKFLSFVNPSKALNSFFKSPFFYDLYVQKQFLSQKEKQKEVSFSQQYSKYFLRDFKLFKYTFLPKGPSHILTLASSKIGIFLAKSFLFTDPTAYVPISLETHTVSCFFSQHLQNLYSSKEQQKLQLMVFLSGKISEFLIQKTKKNSLSFVLFENQNKKSNLNFFTDSNFFENSNEFFNRKYSVFPFEKEKEKSNFDLNSSSFETFQTKSRQNLKKQNLQMEISSFFSTSKKSKQQKIEKNQDSKESFNFSIFSSRLNTNFFWTAFGNDSFWRLATPFIFSIIQKRFLFTENLLLSKMLFFENKNGRKFPPSPPASSILMPSKKYENFKRTEYDFLQKARFSIREKIQMHQQQRFLKQLYNIPVQQYFRSEMIQKRQTFFSSSFQELAYLDSFTKRSSSIHFYQKKYLGIRHRFSNLNQWWNGFLPEHNTEKTYLSDVDWRTMIPITQSKNKTLFTSSQKISKILEKKKNQLQFSEKSQTSTFEFPMDFPDAEQYYNPRNRRWFFNTKFCKNLHQNSSYWLTFDLNLQYEIFYHFIMQSFHQTFEFFDKNREMFDCFVFHLLRKGFFKEIDYLTKISCFKKNE